MMKWRNVVRNVVPLVIGGSKAVVIFSSQMDNLDARAGEKRSAFEKELVDAACTLTPACD
jgi:hypothetical protein